MQGRIGQRLYLQQSVLQRLLQWCSLRTADDATTTDDTSADYAATTDNYAANHTTSVHLWHRTGLLPECDRWIQLLLRRCPKLLQRSVHGCH